ncbi:N-acetylneuraminate synthase [Akkermansiaceae bacterium]|nr:N-acetylneuraminate synthase [Akkermansiaceae bacterium]
MKSKVLIVGEAGVNHNGDIKTAKKLIDIAAEAGVDYVKFQTFKANELVTKKAKQADYQEKNTKDFDNQYEMLKRLELDEQSHQLLIKYCNTKGVKFLSTGFDLGSLDFLYKIGIRLAKIPSGEITNYPYLKKVAELFPKVIMSTGMSSLEDIRIALNILLKFGLQKEDIIILHCNTEYPTAMKDVNLKAMLHIKKEFGIEVGYSDHTLGIEVAIAAVSLGAVVIEKHFTTDRNLSGPDHRASLEPKELRSMVKSIRNIEESLSGSGMKEVSESELKNQPVVRKSIVAITPIAKGEVFNSKNIGTKRPGTGISPIEWEKVIGRISKNNFEPDELIRL